MVRLHCRVIFSFAGLMILCCIPLVSVIAQNNYENLIQSLNNDSKNEIEKIDILINLNKELTGNNNNQAIHYGIKALELALKINHTDKNAEANYYLGITYVYKGIPDSALYYFETARQLYQNLHNETGLYKTLNYIGISYIISDDLLKATHFLNQAYDKAKSIKDTIGMTFALNNLGIVYSKRNLKAEALKNYQEVLQIYTVKSIKKNMAKVLNNIALIHKDEGLYSDAIKVWQKALPLEKEMGTKHGVANILTNMAEVYLLGKNVKEAAQMAEESYKIRIDINDQRGISESQKLLGDINYEKNNFSKAILNYSESLQVLDQVTDKQFATECYLGLAKSYSKQNQREPANKYIDLAIKMANELKYPELQQKTYLFKAVILQNQNQYPEAIQTLTNYILLNDAQLQDSKIKELAKIKSEFDFFEKEQENQFLTKENEIQKLKISREKNYRLILFLIIGLLITVSVLIIRLYQFKKKQSKRLNKLVNVRTKTLEKEIEERKKVQNELHRAKEKAEESDRLKTHFLENISHELRTPLNGIVGFAELLNQEDTTIANKEEYVGFINSCSQRLINTMDDILEMSLLNSGAAEFKMETIELIQPLNSFLELFNQRKINHEIDLKIDIPFTELWVETDKRMLFQVFNNLLNNAYKFTEKGFVKFSLNVNEDFLVFSVRDSGIGIESDYREIIFESFRKIEHKGSKLYEGNGLGLALSKKIINGLGGTVRVESELNNGSEFFVSFPKKMIKKLFIQNSTSGEKSEPVSSLEGKVILIADDEIINFLLVKELLKKDKCKILYAENGQEAIDKCVKNESPDLVIMDIKMPVMNGIEATRKIKEFRKSIPVIAYSAFVLNNEKQMALEAGCDDYLPKPVSRQVIIETIRKHVV